MACKFLKKTNTGRIVYDRDAHFFNYVDANRIIQSTSQIDLTPPNMMMIMSDSMVKQWAAVIDARIALGSIAGSALLIDLGIITAFHSRVKNLIGTRQGKKMNETLVRVRNFLEENKRDVLLDWLTRDLAAIGDLIRR